MLSMILARQAESACGDSGSKMREIKMPRMVALLCGLLLLSGCASMPWAEPKEDAPVTAEQLAKERPQTLVGSVEPSGGSTETASFERTEENDAEFLIQGTDRFVGKARNSIVRSTDGSDGVLLNFVEADIREVVGLILGDTLGVNYLIDSRIQGTITLRSVENVEGEALLDILETALRANGAAMIVDGGTFRVIPLSEAPRAALRPQIGMPGERIPVGYALYILPLRYVSAPQMVELMQPVLGSDAIVRADAARNILLIAAPSAQVQVLVDTALIFDVDFLGGLSLALVPVTEVGADVVVAEIQTILESQSGTTLDGVVTITPVERLNAVLIASKQSAYIRRVKVWINELDRGSANGTRLYVYEVQNGRARDLAALLNDVFAGGSSRSTSGQVAPGLAASRLSGGNAPATASAAAATGGSAPTALRTASSLSARRSLSGQEESMLDVRVIPDEANNALLILSNARDYRMIESTLKKLDVVPLQLLIEATIAEVTLNDRLRYGVQFLFEDGIILDSNGERIATRSTGTLSNNSSGSTNGSFPGFVAVLSDTTGRTQARGVLDALSAITEVNVISSPQLLVQDNQSAELQVGDEVPVITEQRTSSSGDSSLFNSVEFRDTGVILRVSPRITSGGLVTLDIEQEVSSVNRLAETGTLTPTISTRRIVSSISVHDGETIALGGLISETKNSTQNGLPLLGDVPILGALFSTRDTLSERQELLVLISPSIVRNKEDARDVTEELRKHVQALENLIE